MPNFNLGLEFGCNSEIEGSDWVSYYVGIAINRDMLARYIGRGVGHKGTRKCLPNLAKDARTICDPADWEGENTELAQSFQAEMEDLDDTNEDGEMDEDSEDQDTDLYDADEDSEEVQLILDEEEEAEWVQSFDEPDQLVRMKTCTSFHLYAFC
ncbi:hypothetical protein BT96DRAFT_1010078 [Gymnopus androsaceus JB14]|uniref:Uncharacterized protein n=1 Tax=Gymnopus androsaceus JB14 TaxID=1447944 RepID=A0A6A4GB93_9AGAR|nr:hypothetical protein BT96DRAFT_1010078 [Gymnopus androsaceus JB14]